MNSFALVLLLASSHPATVPVGPGSFLSNPFSQALLDGDDAVLVRAQSPGQPIAPLLSPSIDSTTTNFPPTYADPNAVVVQPNGAIPQPYGMPAPIGAPVGDPFLGSGMPYAQPSPNAPWGQYTFGGINGGAQPYRFGWTARYDFTYLAPAGTSSPNMGKFSMFGFDLEKDYVTPLQTGWIFSIAPQFNYRSTNGPNGFAVPASLSPDYYRFGLGLKLATPDIGGSQFEFGFDPAYTTDFNVSPSANGMQYDAHAVWFWRWSPQFMVALGAAYWDRVDNIILPYAGIVYTPNDYLEFRLIFPKPRISLFLGTPNGVATWAYLQGEYHVESYEMDMAPMGARDQVQFSDWRVMGGLRFEAGWLTTFVEAGGVFGRDVKFHSVGENFNVDPGLVLRAGFRY